MPRTATLVLSGLFLALIATAPLAQTVSSDVEINNAGALSSDPQGPSNAAVTSNLTFPGAATIDFSGDGFGKATQRPDGVGAVLADVLIANGQPVNHAVASTNWTETVTNNTGVSTNYTFDFFITPPSLRIADYARLEETDLYRPDVSFQVTILANGSPIFQSEAHLIGGVVSHVLNETGTSLSPAFVPGSVRFGYDFQPYADTIVLGPVAPGGSLTVEYQMVARVETPGFESGGRAQIGDPFDLDGTPGFSGTLTPGGPVPVEETTWGQIKSLYQ